jgi:hypothetical protein
MFRWKAQFHLKKLGKIFWQIVELVHKNTKLLLILIVCGFIFCMLAKHIIGDSSRFSRGLDIFDPKIGLRCAQAIWGSKKSWPPLKTHRNCLLCVLPT